jgi:hypothetical protein
MESTVYSGYDPHIDRKYNLIPLLCPEMEQALALIVKDAAVAPMYSSSK